MLIVAPTYLSESSLPYASDILYHNRFAYCLPTGFHPIGAHSVAGFPTYCSETSTALPKWVWDSCGSYFESARIALSCLEILAPLREKHIAVISTVYARDRAAIDNAKGLLRAHPSLKRALTHVDLDMRFVSREVLSHVLFEIFIEEGYRGAIDYFRENSQSPDTIFDLVAAVLLNRVRSICEGSTPIMVYEHSWYPVLEELTSIQSGGRYGQIDSDVVEHFSYKLFESILLPLYGRVDSRAKAKLVAKLCNTQAASVAALKASCTKISRDVVLLPTTDSSLRQQVLTEGITTHVAEPLAELIHKPQRDLLGLLRRFTLDSTVIGGLLAITDATTTASAVGLALAAGALSTGAEYLLNERQAKPERPSQILMEGMRHAGLQEQEVLAKLNNIPLSSVDFPKIGSSIRTQSTRK